MSHSSKLVIVIILLLNTIYSNYGQDKLALRYNEEVNFDVEIVYLSGDEEDYKSLLLYKTGIVYEVMSMFDSAGIQVNEKIETPKLLLKVTADHNLENKSSRNDGWYYVTSEIYLIDKVKLTEHPSIKIETITWRGDWTRTFVSEENVGIIRNENIAEIAKSFINDYLEINPD
jgi:hypothetical protein